MTLSKYHMVEFRMRMYAKESPWAKLVRLKELAKHKKRCKSSRGSSNTSCPHYSTHILVNRKRAEIEEVLGGASNWIGKYENTSKKLCDARPWRSLSNARPHPAPFSTLKLSPRGDKMRMIERNLMEMYDRIKEVEEMNSQYKPVKKTYLSRGDSLWPKPPSRTTTEDKLDRVKKWEMKYKKRVQTAPTGGFFGFFTLAPKKMTPPKPSPRPATAPAEGIHKPKVEEDPNSISAVTAEEADKDKQLELLKAVQEVGDTSF